MTARQERADHEILAKGVRRQRVLPSPELGALWDSIIVDGALRSSFSPKPS